MVPPCCISTAKRLTKAHGQSVLYSTETSGSHSTELIILLILLFGRHLVTILEQATFWIHQQDDDKDKRGGGGRRQYCNRCHSPNNLPIRLAHGRTSILRPMDKPSARTWAHTRSTDMLVNGGLAGGPLIGPLGLKFTYKDYDTMCPRHAAGTSANGRCYSGTWHRKSRDSI